MNENERAARARQLILDLARPPSYDADDFLVSPSNADAHALVERWPEWPDRSLLLIGPTGSGKSHLGTMWARRTGAKIVRPGDRLDPDEATARPVILLEDCDRAAHPEALLFHLFNRVRNEGGDLLLTARTPPSVWGLTTPDLVSRLRLAPWVMIGRPDRALMSAVLAKLFADRQIRIEDDVIAYAVRHCEQSLEALNLFVAAVDEASLAEGRRITRPLAARTIAALAGEELPPE